jgi:hypothetical protein
LRFVNVFELGTVDNRGDYRLRLYYDSLDQKNFPAVLDELATGILGAVAYWRSERPTLVAHSAALEKFFDFLDKKIVATLRGTDHLTDGQRISLAFKLVRDNLSPLVDSVSVNGGEYMVRFKTRTGSRSPWVLVPVVFGYADLPSSGKMASGQAAMVANPAFGGTGGFKTAGPFYYYRGADSEASLEPAKLGYDPENLYWKY